MPPSLRELARRLGHVPGLDRAAAAVEDRIDFHRHAGTPARERALRARFAACRTTDDWIALARSLLQVTQIDREIGDFLQLCAVRQVRRILEIGTAQGGTTLLLSRAISTTEWLLTVDLLPRHPRLLRWLATPLPEFHVLRGSSAAASTRQRIIDLVGAAPLDLLFIDGDHSYEGARTDYLLYRDLVRPGGLIAFHDIVPAAETGRPTAGHRWVGGVPQLWTELKSAGGTSWEFVENWNQQGFGIGVLEAGSRAMSPRG